MTDLQEEMLAEVHSVGAVCFDPGIFGADLDETGRWLLVPDPVERKTEGETEFVIQRWSLLWVYEDGRALQGPAFISSQTVGYQDQTDAPEIAILRHLFDYNGDGRSELLLPVRRYEDGGHGSRRLWVLTITDDGRIVEYAPHLKNPVWAEDVDGDGRPDLMLDPNDVRADPDLPRHATLIPGGWQLAHSLPDGTFSTSDAVATSFSRDRAGTRNPAPRGYP